MSRPQAFGHYDLLDRVNVGGMAEVFRARDRDSGEICAVKRILPEVAEDEEFVRMFRDEARLARLLEHPNIARILDLGRVEGTYFLALQYVDGHDLRTLFDHQARKRETIPLAFLVHVLIKVCEGLEYAHQKKDDKGRPLNLVHRDVSPQNILVGFDGDVKLIDFGIAKSSMKLSKTQVGTIKGKYAYMSPEQVRGLPLDHRSDLFSLGICAWELFTLHRLFASDNEMLIMERVKDAELSPPRRINPAVPVEVDRIVMRALSRDVDERYGSAADLKADLQAFAYAGDLKWGREDVATYMRRTFASEKAGAEGSPAGLFAGEGSALNPSGVHPGGGAMNGNSTQLPTKPSAQELVMADNKGSDLDVFEGLAAKPTSTRRPTTSAAPPPPPVSSRSAPPPPAPPPRRNATQMGIGMPLPPMSSPPLTPPPRTSTPPIAPPPSRSPLSVAPAKSAAATPAANPRGAMVDMDWDDEDEKTHVYDKDVVGQMAKSSAGVPTPPPMALPTPRPPAPPSGNLKSTMVGMSAPLAPPSRSDRPLAPPSRPPSRASSGGMPAAGAPLPPPAPPPGAPFSPPQSAPPQMAAATLPFHAPPAPAPAPTPMPSVVAPTPAPAPQPVMGPQFVGGAPAPAMTPMPRQVVDQTQVIRPKGSSSTLLIVGGVLFAGAAAVGAYLWASNRPGNIVVSVDPPPKEVSIQVDGVEKCKDSSCRVEVAPGAHIVKVIAGDFTSQKQVTVEPAKDVVVPISIQITDSPKEATNDPPKSTKEDDKTVLKIAALPDGVKVSIDGGDPLGLPLTNESIKPGKHHLKFAGAKFKTKEIDVTVDEGSTKKVDQDDVHILPTAVAMKFTLPAKGAKAQVSDGAKKQDLSDGKSVDLDPEKSYVVTATAPGFEDFTSPLKLGDEAEQSFKIEMVEKSKPVAVATANPQPKPTGDPPPKPTAEPTAKPAGGDGTLFINTLPKSNCVVNGTPRGATPITITVPAGTYNVTCVAKDGEEVLKKGGSATVPAGGKGTLTLKLRD